MADLDVISYLFHIVGDILTAGDFAIFNEFVISQILKQDKKQWVLSAVRTLEYTKSQKY